MRIELKGLLAGLIAALAVLGAVFGVSAIVSSHFPQKDGASRSAAMTANTKRMDAGTRQTTGLQMVAAGHALYTQSCASCHGASGGGGYGPGLHHEDLSDAAITLKIKNGISGKMPAFHAKYNENQIRALIAYIRSLK